MSLLTHFKLDMLQETMTGPGMGPEAEEVEASFGRTVAAFFKFWLFGSGLVTIATAMVRLTCCAQCPCFTPLL